MIWMVHMTKSSVWLPRAREKEIAELAEYVAEQYCPDDIVDPVKIAHAKGITISFNQYVQAYDGMLEHRDGRFHIYCNLDRVEQRDSPRARFTIGHELGHYFVDEHRNALKSGRAPKHGSKCEYESQLYVEREADHFASNLLMPPSRFRLHAAQVEKGLKGILYLKERFGTSVTSTAITYAKADILPCAVFKWTATELAWKWLSTETYRARYRQSIQQSGELPYDSATARALAEETPPSRGFFRSGTTASAWFRHVKDSGYRNAIMWEEAISLGRFGTLTFLYPDLGSYSEQRYW